MQRSHSVAFRAKRTFGEPRLPSWTYEYAPFAPRYDRLACPQISSCMLEALELRPMTDEGDKRAQLIQQEPGTVARTEAAPPAKTSSWLGTAAFGLAGVVIGGFLQYYFSQSLETDKQRMQIQQAAHADFAKAQAAWQRALREEDESKKKTAILDAQLKIQDAAFRIVIFSPSEVVKAFAAFVQEKQNQECNTTKSDLAIYQKMRRQTLGKDDISDQDIAMALFGCKLK